LPAETQDVIIQFLSEEVLGVDHPDIGPDQALLAGLVDSNDLMRLVAFLEENFDVTIENEEVVTENFRSVEALAAFVDTKRGASG
jgi:acyl carrier protein